MRFRAEFRVLVVAASAVMSFGLVGPAWAYCSEPSPPGKYGKPDKPDPPSKPYCANTYNGSHTCSDWEIRNYNSEIETYNSKMETYQRDVKEYVRKLKSYIGDAEEYAVCEVRSLDD